MTESEQPAQPDDDVRDVPAEQSTDESGGDGRDPARQAAGEAAESEGEPREGEERRATGNPDAAGGEGDH
jgi:hypothetical protein